LQFGVTAHQKHYQEIFNPLSARLYGSFMLKIDYLSKQGNIKIITRFKSGIILYPSRIRILAMVNKKHIISREKHSIMK
jgi:hypothetical protein